MLLVIFCLIRPIYSLFAKADFPDVDVKGGKAPADVLTVGLSYET